MPIKCLERGCLACILQLKKLGISTQCRVQTKIMQLQLSWTRHALRAMSLLGVRLQKRARRCWACACRKTCMGPDCLHPAAEAVRKAQCADTLQPSTAGKCGGPERCRARPCLHAAGPHLLRVA